VEDIWGFKLRPPRRFDRHGEPYHLCYLRPYIWGGKTKSGLFVDHGGEDLPITYGVVLSLRHESPHSILRLERDLGGVMPGDLVYFPRYAALRISDVEFEHEGVDGVGGIHVRYPLLVMHEDMMIGRVDGVLPDPYAEALAKLEAAK